MENLNFLKISWEKLNRQCYKLAGQIKKLPPEERIDIIVAISRGGLVAARILSDILSIHISHITISSYSDLKQQKQLIIREFPSRSFHGETILLVDEISDTGKIFERALSYFSNFNLKKIYTLAPYIKPHTKFVPDFWAVKTAVWVIFPYELKETYDAFKKIYKSDKVVENKLLEIGYRKWEINAFKT